MLRERHSMYIRRHVEKLPPPWTNDPILANHRFTNFDRELDRTSIWIRENLRDPLRNDPKVFLAIVAARWFCRIESIDKIKDLLLEGKWDSKVARRRLYLSDKIVTGAFMCKSPSGMDKLDGVLFCIDNIARDAERITTEWVPEKATLEGMWNLLREYPYCGPFVAYEFTTDLRFTWMLEKAPDINTWANLGPGATKGMGYIIHGDENHWCETSKKDQQEMLVHLRKILEMSRDPKYWPSEFPRWDSLHVAEFGTCEFSKYRHALEGRRLKRNYP